MRISIYQPRYFPQLHYFNRMLTSDVFVFLDCAQYTKSIVVSTPEGKQRYRSYQSDTPIKLPTGLHLLTIPIHHNGYSAINKTGIAYRHHWIQKHVAVIKAAYQKAPYFEEIFEQLHTILFKKYMTLAQLNIMTTLWGINRLYDFDIPFADISIETINQQLAKKKPGRLQKFFLGSLLGVTRPYGLQKGTEWTTAICEKIGATEYVHGATAQINYMDLTYYRKRGIEPIVQDWQCPEYEQRFATKTDFLPNLSIVDLLCNMNTETSRKILGAEE